MVTAGIAVQITSARVFPCVLKRLPAGTLPILHDTDHPTSTSTNAMPVMIRIARNRTVDRPGECRSLGRQPPMHWPLSV